MVTEFDLNIDEKILAQAEKHYEDQMIEQDGGQVDLRVIKGDSQPVLAAEFVNLVVRDKSNNIIMISETMDKTKAKDLAINFEFTEMVTPEEGRILKIEMCSSQAL